MRQMLAGLQLTELIGVRPEKLGALDVVPERDVEVTIIRERSKCQPDVNLFVLRMSSIVRGAHWKQNHILTRCFLRVNL